MKILFLCTAHNSLSQRLSLVLSDSHDVSIEYALSDEVMIGAVQMARPDIVICPFLTTLVPKQIYNNYLTLIVHPGPPGDAGPSALDWALLGDDGSIDDPSKVLASLDQDECRPGRSHWGVTVLQAIEEFDAGPIWAWDQFPLNIDRAGLTKSDLYRTYVSQAAVLSVLKAIDRIQEAALSSGHDFAGFNKSYEGLNITINCMTCSPELKPRMDFGRRSVSDNLPFQGGKTHNRPLLKAADREFDLVRHSAQQISRRIRCADSQPGVLSKAFGRNVYLYGGIIEESTASFQRPPVLVGSTSILATRNEAVCIATCDGKGIWITHTRKPKSKFDKALWPKVPATFGLMELGILNAAQIHDLESSVTTGWSLSLVSTFQEVWIDFAENQDGIHLAYLYFDFYNGAMSTNQCSQLINAMDYILSRSSSERPISAVVLMGGSYFSNGIALNVIEASDDPATESWLNINRIDDVVRYLLHEFPSRGIRTVAAMRGNAAAGGVALATACDIVIAASDIVINPAYRTVGLYGSEYHTLSYYGRCGKAKAQETLRAMLPMSPIQAQAIKLIDFTFPGHGAEFFDNMNELLRFLLKPGIDTYKAAWKQNVDLSPASLARARAMELSEMSKDFWSPRSQRYHNRRFDFVRKVKASQTPLRFATHRRLAHGVQFDEEELDSFDDVHYYEQLAARKVADRLRDEVRKELSSLVTKWAGQEGMPRTHRRGSVALLTEQNTAHVALPGTERKTETVFSCYYKPVDAPLTPPISPTFETPLVQSMG